MSQVFALFPHPALSPEVFGNPDRFSRQQYDYIVLAAQLRKYGAT